MAGRLTAVEVRNKREPGQYGDGQGLYLEILPSGVRQWFLRYQLAGRRRQMSLGAVTDLNGLGVARQSAADARDLIRPGIDPIDARKRPVAAPLFSVAATELIDALAPAWRGSVTRKRWERCLLVYAARLGPRPVDDISAADVLAVLRPLWSTKPETGAKLRECVERVLDAQRAAGAIRGPWENPARWKGHLEHTLPPRKRLSRGHHAAMPYADAPAFLAAIRAQESMGARALELAILTTVRAGVVASARWDEIEGGVWTISAARMKSARGLRVPLSPAALALLERVAGAGRKGWVFPGRRQPGRTTAAPHITGSALAKVLTHVGLPYTAHGFRSTFRDWAGDCTDHARETVEEALAHAVGDETERAYRRSDALEKRRRLMEDWADYLDG